jgi:GNAT superfamily N-acetyltransferase
MKSIRKIEHPKCAAALFAGWEETIIWSCLQGMMGNVYGDDPEHPASAAAVLGDFCFLAGEPSRVLAAYKPESVPQDFMIMVPKNEAWGQVIQDCWGEKAKEITRYALKKDPNAFDRKRLLTMTLGIPDGYEIKSIDKALYQKCRNEAWSRDLVKQYPDFGEYERLGLGFAVLYGGEIVAGASSYSSYQEGIEIEIDTRRNHRRKGLARACAAALILECQRRGLYPSWDAHNSESLALAEQLGYRLAHPYTAYEIYECGNLPLFDFEECGKL